jgi:hypothetical protein
MNLNYTTLTAQETWTHFFAQNLLWTIADVEQSENFGT